MLSNQNSYLREVRESQKVFSALVHAMEKSHKAVVAAIEERQKEEERRMKTLVEELEQEVRELRAGTADPGPEILVTIDRDEVTKEVAVVRSLICRGPVRQRRWK